ncbi:hypothetical protein CBER1_01781 [Cercospora berteroae]|uniref:DUF998 domain-containing protein n=1 Tax=Cercospora berteroae TaxID=357750 RepID=A0A2S6CA98_9PEZI|nr:hypothetical protein CBER1_01781 [Cercospora berteroae]
MAQAASKKSLAPLFPAAILILSSLAWLPIELYCHLWFEEGLEGYNWKIESLSDLGVNYRQVHELKHYNVVSFAYQWFNGNLYQAGVCFAVAQLSLIFLTRKNVTSETAFLRTARTLLTLFVLLGFSLFATIHGGPRESFWKIIGWHWMGLGLIGVAGNLNSLLSTLKPNQLGQFEGNPVYKLVSSVLAGFGLYSYYRFNALGEWNYETPIGLWQRGTIYPLLAWELLTGIFLVLETFSGPSTKPKKA